MLLTAALETILIAALALIATQAGAGSAATETFLRLNAALVAPFRLLPFPAVILEQLAAVVGYGLLGAMLSGAVAWLDRRQALGY